MWPLSTNHVLSFPCAQEVDRWGTMHVCFMPVSLYLCGIKSIWLITGWSMSMSMENGQICLGYSGRGGGMLKVWMISVLTWNCVLWTCTYKEDIVTLMDTKAFPPHACKIFILGYFSKLFCLIFKVNFEHCHALLLLFKENQAYSQFQSNCFSSPIYKDSFCVGINCKTFLGLLYTFGNSKNLMFHSMCW